MGVGHYENFPVASLLLPARLRHPVATIYRFARTADDFADEGDLTRDERLAHLGHYDDQLRAIAAGIEPVEPLFSELARVIRRHQLPIGLFHDLLDAFSQDCVKNCYDSFAELRDYSRRSANPIGRLLLQLFDAASAENLRRSDNICTALQLINFWQDIAIDFAKNRVYLPREDLERFGVPEAHIAQGYRSEEFAALLRFQIDRTRELLYSGASLGRTLKGRIGLEIRMIVAGGDTILQKLLDVDCDVFRHRPVLRMSDWVHMCARALTGDGRVAA
jgi:phytoene synthase